VSPNLYKKHLNVATFKTSVSLQIKNRKFLCMDAYLRYNTRIRNIKRVQFWTILYDSETTDLELKQYELQDCISFDKIVFALYRQKYVARQRVKYGSTHSVLTSAKADSSYRVTSLSSSPQYMTFKYLQWQFTVPLPGMGTRRKTSRPRRDRDETFVALET